MKRRQFIKSSAAAVGLGMFHVITGGRAVERELDLIIRDAVVYDGSGKPGFAADVGLRGDRIAAIGNLKDRTAGRILAADGRFLCPGFIDIHAHSEDELLVNPRAESKIRQGVTTEILGQDGNSIAPLNTEMQQKLDESYRTSYGLSVSWQNFYGYFSQLQQRGTAVNVGTMLGQGTLREFVVGRQNRPATFAEITRMQELVEQALNDGVLGISSGLEYTPGGFASSEEITQICKVMNFATGIYATHMRNEADFVVEALDEAIAVARGADVALHISHIKCMGERNWPKLDIIFERIEEARRRGVTVTMDRYPYTAYNTDISSLFPLWSRSGPPDQFINRLRNPDILPRIRKETLGKVNMIGSWHAVMITSADLEKNRYLIGKRVSEVAGNNGADEFEFVRRLIIEEGAGINMCGFAMSEENTSRILAHPLCMVASDASARANYGKLAETSPHPRTYGTFPRVLGRYVREQKVMDWEEAIRKMTSLPAGRLGLRDRGLVREGYIADLVVFDPQNIIDKATFTEPHQYAEGIDFVMVSGVPVIEQGEHTGALPGRVLKGRRRGDY